MSQNVLIENTKGNYYDTRSYHCCIETHFNVNLTNRRMNKQTDEGTNIPKYELLSRAATFTKFGKRLHEFQ